MSLSRIVSINAVAYRGNSTYIDGSKNVFIKPADKFPSPRDFTEFFKNKQNKRRLQSFLKNELSKDVQQRKFKLIYSVGEECWDLRNGQQRKELECSHAEADTIIFFIYHQFRSLGMTETVVIDAEDADIVVLSAKVSHDIKGDLGIKRKKATLDCKKLCSPDLAKVIVPFHCHTGCDFTSGFYGHGKASIMKQLQKTQGGTALLAAVGEKLPVTSEMQKNLEEFTLRCIYNDHSSRNLSEARAKKWTHMKRKTTQRLPPDEDSHSLHAARVNYVSLMLNNYHRRTELPHHCITLENGKNNFLFEGTNNCKIRL